MSKEPKIEIEGARSATIENIDLTEREAPYFSDEQNAELKRLDFEYQRASLAASILEQKAKIKQLQEFLSNPKPESPKVKRSETDY